MRIINRISIILKHVARSGETAAAKTLEGLLDLSGCG